LLLSRFLRPTRRWKLMHSRYIECSSTSTSPTRLSSATSFGLGDPFLPSSLPLLPLHPPPHPSLPPPSLPVLHKPMSRLLFSKPSSMCPTLPRTKSSSSSLLRPLPLRSGYESIRASLRLQQRVEQTARPSRQVVSLEAQVLVCEVPSRPLPLPGQPLAVDDLLAQAGSAVALRAVEEVPLLSFSNAGNSVFFPYPTPPLPPRPQPL
jgi:hypothetical protein